MKCQNNGQSGCVMQVNPQSQYVISHSHVLPKLRWVISKQTLNQTTYYAMSPKMMHSVCPKMTNPCSCCMQQFHNLWHKRPRVKGNCGYSSLHFRRNFAEWHLPTTLDIKSFATCNHLKGLKRMLHKHLLIPDFISWSFSSKCRSYGDWRFF